MASDSVVYSLNDVVDSEIQRPWLAAVTLTADVKSLNGHSGNSNDSVSGTKLHDSQDVHCVHGALLGPLALFVQASLAFIAFTSLIVKRFCEPKSGRRSWLIWFFDTSKQAIGAAVIHFANVFLADVFTGDPCTWYIVSFLLDSTVGLVVIYICLQISQFFAKRKGWDSLILGEYGTPPQCNAWGVQCGLYIVVMLIEKFLMTLLVLFHFWGEVRRFIMWPIKDPKVELVIVMFIVPFVVNAFIFWVVDNFLKRERRGKSAHNSVRTNGSVIKYSKAGQKVKYFNDSENAEDSESDVLLSLDDEPDSELVDINDIRSPGKLERYQLIGTTVT